MGSARLARLLLLWTVWCSLHQFVSSGEVPTVYVQLGGEVTIVCDLDESQTDVQWMRGPSYQESQSKLVAYTLDGVEDGDCLSSGKCAFSNGRDLTISNVQLSDQDRYYCSSSGKEYTEKLLSIRVEPNMPYPMINFCGDEQNCTFPFPVGYPTWLRCEVTGSIPAVDLIWYNETDPIGDVKTEVRENIGGTFDSVSRLGIDYSTHSVFRCEAVGDSVPNERRAVATINITERDGPDIEEILPTNFSIVEPLKKYPHIFHCYDQRDCTYEFPNGYNLLLTCEMEGSRPAVHLEWTNGTAVLDSVNTVYNITNGLFNTFSTLEVEHNDTSVYYCVASGISLPGKLTASITVTGVDVPVAAPKEGLSGGGKAAVAAGGAVSVGVVAGVAREPIQKTGCCLLKMIPGMGDNDSDTESTTRTAARRRRKRKKRRKDRDVEADLEEDEQFIDDEEVEMNEVEAADDEIDASVHEEEEVAEDPIEVEEENIQMSGVPLIDDVESTRTEEQDEEEEEENEEAEDDVLLPRKSSKPEKVLPKKAGKGTAAATTGRNAQSQNTGNSRGTGKPDRKPASSGKTPKGKQNKTTKAKPQKQEIAEEDEEEESSKFRLSSLLQVPKRGLDSLKDTVMEKVDDVATSGKDFIGQYLPSEAEEILDNLQEKITNQLEDTVDDKVEDVETYVEDKTDEFQTSVEDKATELQEAVVNKVKGKENSDEIDVSKTQAAPGDESKRSEGRATEISKDPRSTATGKTNRLNNPAMKDEYSANQPSVTGQTGALNASKTVNVLSSNTTADLKFRTESTPLEMNYFQLEEDDVLIKFRMKGSGLKLKVCHGLEDDLYELSIEFIHNGKIGIHKNGHPVKLNSDQVKNLSYKPGVPTSFAINISQYQLVIIVDDGIERSAKFKVHSELCHFIGIGQTQKGNFEVTFFPKKGKDM